MSRRYVPKAEAEQALRTLFQYIGEDPEREGLVDTPARILRAWEQDWGAGYATSPPNLTRFFSKPNNFDEMVCVSGLQVLSHCEHHLAPFFGSACICYLPVQERGVLGLSKFARIVQHFSRRLQVQERLTTEIAQFLQENVSDHVAVSIRARHTCMMTRGVMEPNAETHTTALRGAFFDNNRTRAEFFSYAGR